jgi:hypothetical protein
LQLILQLFQDESVRDDLQIMFVEDNISVSSTVQGDFRTFFGFLLSQIDHISHIPRFQMLHPLTLQSQAISSLSVGEQTESESKEAHTDIESILADKESLLRLSIQQDFVTIAFDCLLAWWTLIVTPKTATLPVSRELQQMSSSSGASNHPFKSPQNTSEQWIAYFIEQCDWMRITYDFLVHFDMIQRHKYISQCYEQQKKHSSPSMISLKEYEATWMNHYFTSFQKENIKAILQSYQHCIAYSAFMQVKTKLATIITLLSCIEKNLIFFVCVRNISMNIKNICMCY